MLDFLKQNFNISTWLLIVVIILTFEGSSYIIGFQKRKATSYTVMTLLNDMAELAQKGGSNSWIDYIYKKYGKENGFVYINQIYMVLDKNKIKDPRYEKVRKDLKAYLQSENKKKKEAKKGTK